MTPECLPCPPEQQRAALAVMYGRFDASAQRAEFALGESRAGRLDLRGLWIAHMGGEVVAAVLTQDLGGDAAALWAPESRWRWGPRRARVVAALLRSVLADLGARGVLIVQCLPDVTVGKPARRELTAAGLGHVTDLVTMRRNLRNRPAESALEWTWQTFEPKRRVDFVAAVEDALEDSLDLPELRSVQSAERVLDAHGGGWPFDPALWMVGSRDDGARGVILLAKPADRGVVELRFLGLSRPARGKGLGADLLARAMAAAATIGTTMELAVDVRNVPAMRLYSRSGFTTIETRPLYLKVFEGTRSSASEA